MSEVLNPILYPAKELTYSADLSATPRGIHLAFSGFSDPAVMERYINTTVTSESTHTHTHYSVTLSLSINYRYGEL